MQLNKSYTLCIKHFSIFLFSTEISDTLALMDHPVYFEVIVILRIIVKEIFANIKKKLKARNVRGKNSTTASNP